MALLSCEFHAAEFKPQFSPCLPHSLPAYLFRLRPEIPKSQLQHSNSSGSCPPFCSYGNTLRLSTKSWYYKKKKRLKPLLFVFAFSSLSLSPIPTWTFLLFILSLGSSFEPAGAINAVPRLIRESISLLVIKCKGIAPRIFGSCKCSEHQTTILKCPCRMSVGASPLTTPLPLQRKLPDAPFSDSPLYLADTPIPPFTNI